MRTLVLSAVVGLCACGGGPPPGRVVQTDGGVLSYLAQLNQFDGTDQFSWNVQTAQAYVRFDGTALTHGSVNVTGLDAAGAKVLAGQPVGSGPAPASSSTASGVPGLWSVRLDFTDATGTLAFRATPAR